jgi:hypothetical protein
MKYFAELDKNNLVIGLFSLWEGDTLNGSENPQFYRFLEYSEDTSITNNQPIIGFTYDENLNAFIPPQPDPTYILNTQTFEWEPDENLEYDLHGDGKLYRYNKELNGWTPTWDPEDNN